MIVTYQTYCTNIKVFTFDNGTADSYFAHTLSTSQNWFTEFTQRITDEYKRCIMFCCISPTGAAPPDTIEKPCIFSTAPPPPDTSPPPRKSFPITNAPPTPWNNKTTLTAFLFLFIALLICAPDFRHPIPYILNAPQLPAFFIIYTIYILIPPLNYTCITKCWYTSKHVIHRALPVSYTYAVERIKKAIYMKQKQHSQFNPNKL
ncbi:hypothetical protein SAMN05428949_0080 [Chitinophaga sp. YR627]|nr:hypothetical protein SAMN05428949_0080 [Chitinophaga sp. YR627]